MDGSAPVRQPAPLGTAVGSPRPRRRRCAALPPCAICQPPTHPAQRSGCRVAIHRAPRHARGRRRPSAAGRAGWHVCTAGVGRPRNDRRKRASDCVRSGAHGGATAARHDGALRRRPRRWDSQSGGFASAAQPPSRFHVAAALEPRRFLLELSPTGRSWLEKGRSRYDGGGLGGASRHVSNAQWWMSTDSDGS
jgi:hypothetical protein